MNQIIMEKWECSSMVNFSILQYLTPYRILEDMYGEFTGDKSIVYSSLIDHLR